MTNSGYIFHDHNYRPGEITPGHFMCDRYGIIKLMNEKTKLLYDLMLRKGYPETFTRLICVEMNTDFTAERMISYISRGEHRLEDVADEMLAIMDLREHIKNKHISEHAQAAVNDLYRNINEE